MVSMVEEDIDFNFNFLDSGPPNCIFLALAHWSSTGHNKSLTAALSQHESQYSGAIEKATILSVASMLKSSLDFSQSPSHGILDSLPSMFTAFQNWSSTCSETLIQVGNFKAQKERLDVTLSERKTTLAALGQKKKDFAAKEELVKKLEAELVQ